MDLLERAPFLHALHDLLREAAAGHGHLVLLGGEAGSGKTVLVQRFGRAVEGTAKVLVGACDALSTPRPLGPLLDIAGGLGEAVERLILDAGQRTQLFGAVLDVLRGPLKPTLIVFEDAHWADEATLDLLRFLGRRLEPTRTLLIVTFREDEVGPNHPLRVVMGDLATSRAVRRLSLPSLSAGAVARLAVGSGLDSAALHQQTSGNPFFVTEVLAAGTARIPETVRDAVLARAARLSAPAREVLEAAAVIDPPVEAWLLDAVAGEAAAAIDECFGIGMLWPAGDAVSFRHELARGAILQAISVPRRTALHARALTALRSVPSSVQDPARLAHHAEAARDRDAVLTYAPLAAQQAAALRAHREAAAQWTRALRFADDLDDEQRTPLLAGLAWECYLTGQTAEAIAARQALIEIARRAGDPLQEAEQQSWTVHDMVFAGRNAEAEEASRTALRLVEPLPPTPTHALAWRVQAYLRMLNRDCADAVHWGERAIELAERFGDRESLVNAWNSVGSARVVSGEEEQGRADLELSRQLASESGLDVQVALALSNLGSAHGEVYRLALADRYLTEGIAYATNHDLDGNRLYMIAWLALVRCYQGDWTIATEHSGTVIANPNTRTISRIMALVALGRVRARRGDPDVSTALDEALALAAPTGTLQRLGPVRAARAEAAWLSGDYARTAAEARAGFDLALKHRHRWFVGELAYWLWRAGELTTPPPDAAAPFALQIAGDWAGAAAAWEALGCPYETARALADGDEPALRRALAEFQRLGARSAAASVAQRLRDLGARGVARGPRPATRANAAGLTPREVEVLALVAVNQSNAEIAAQLFLSPKTVDHHISAILAKLGVTSRGDATRVAAELGLLDRETRDPSAPK